MTVQPHQQALPAPSSSSAKAEALVALGPGVAGGGAPVGGGVRSHNPISLVASGLLSDLLERAALQMGA